MKQTISLHVGQTGVQIGSTIWELYWNEHGIQPDGTLRPDLCLDYNYFHTIFREKQSGQYVPRALFVDTDPTSINSVRKNDSILFDQDSLVSGDQDTSNIFARGYYNLGCDIIGDWEDAIRLMAENCDSFEGFQIFHSMEGGTGSGLTALLLQVLESSYEDLSNFSYSIYPFQRKSTSVVEPYNSMLGTSRLLQYISAAFVIENDAVYNIVHRNLNIERPSYTDMNELIAQVLSSTTASIRFDSARNGNLREIETSIVMFERLKFLLNSYAPIDSTVQSDFFTLSQRFESCIQQNNTLALCDGRSGKYMASCINILGELNSKDVSVSISNFLGSNIMPFFDWTPNALKCNVIDKPPSQIKGGNMAIQESPVWIFSNNTAVQDVFLRMNYRFDTLFSKRAYLHWFQKEGEDEYWFQEARDEMEQLHLDYKELSSEVDDDENEDDY